MIPLKDRLPSRTRPMVVYAIVAVNCAAWVYELAIGRSGLERFLLEWGFVPLRLAADGDPQKWVTPLSSMFLHGGWMHLVGNMWFLWIFGDNVEDALGHVVFVLFYVLCGLGATLLQLAFSLGSGVPMIGASGAIAGVLGAYACFFPRARVLTLVPIFIFIQFIEIPAIVFILLWLVFQLVSGCTSIGLGAGAGGVAWWAHVGGFAAGWLFARAWRTLVLRRGAR